MFALAVTFKVDLTQLDAFKVAILQNAKDLIGHRAGMSAV